MFNWPLCTFYNVWVNLVGAVPVGVALVHMVSGRVGSPQTLRWGVDPTQCLSYILLGHTHTHGRGLPVGIIWVSWSGKWRLFLIFPVIIISVMKLSSWGHKYHCCLFTWIFISWLCRRQCIFLECFCYHGVIFLVLKATDQYSHLCWGVSPNNSRECPGVPTSACLLHWHFYCYCFLFCFQGWIYKQKETMVSLVISFTWKNWGTLDPLWYQ